MLTMTTSPGWSELFKQIYSASPWPTLMLGEDGRVLGASDEPGNGSSQSALAAGTLRADASTADTSSADTALRDRAGHYLSLLRGDAPWLTPQEAHGLRTLPSGAVVSERLHLRRTEWGACLVIVAQPDLQPSPAADLQTARLASLGFMVAGVCHEVTNPLTSLHSIVQILRAEKQPSQALLDKGLANIAVNVKRILDISRRLVQFSRVGDEPRMRFAVDDAVEEAAHVLQQQGRLQHIDLQHQPDASAIVFGNIGPVREIFLNLFVNAAQAMAGRGRLRVVTRCAGPLVEVLVSDSGPGVPTGLACRVFEPFFTTRAAQLGTGLGLAICTEIALEHGGSIELRNHAPEGALFCVTLPRAPA